MAKKVIYYSDPLNDDFAGNHITTKPVVLIPVNSDIDHNCTLFDVGFINKLWFSNRNH